MPRILQFKEFSGSGTTPSYFLAIINLAILGQLYLTVGHGLQTPNESFFSNIPNILAKYIVRYFRVFWIVPHAQILSLCYP